jgi:hypothetical protein
VRLTLVCGDCGAQNNYLCGGKNYKLNIPASAPAKTSWSMTVHDAQTCFQGANGPAVSPKR